MGKLADKIAIVTGGARGMGAATSQIFAAEGAQSLSRTCSIAKVKSSPGNMATPPTTAIMT